VVKQSQQQETDEALSRELLRLPLFVYQPRISCSGLAPPGTHTHEDSDDKNKDGIEDSGGAKKRRQR
jgi:hypothetical protein